MFSNSAPEHKTRIGQRAFYSTIRESKIEPLMADGTVRRHRSRTAPGCRRRDPPFRPRGRPARPTRRTRDPFKPWGEEDLLTSTGIPALSRLPGRRGRRAEVDRAASRRQSAAKVHRTPEIMPESGIDVP